MLPESGIEGMHSCQRSFSSLVGINFFTIVRSRTGRNWKILKVRPKIQGSYYIFYYQNFTALPARPIIKRHVANCAHAIELSRLRS